MPSIQPQCSTQSAWKQCGARHARLNRVTRTVARRFAQSTSESSKTLPRGSNGGRSPLARLSPLSFAVQRKMEPPEVVGFVERLVKNVQRKISPPEVAGLVERLVKNVQRKISPPEVASKVERQVKTVKSKISPPEVASCRARLVKRKNARLHRRRP